MNATPRIYAACLASYNNGILHGAWIDADQDSEDILQNIAEMLERSPITGAEEWAVHDYEGLPTSLGEYPDLDLVAEVAQGIEEHGDAFRAYVELVGAEFATVEDFQDNYIGEYQSQAELAENLLTDSGEFAQVPERLQWFIDFDAYGRDLIAGGSVCREGNHWFYNA